MKKIVAVLFPIFIFTLSGCQSKDDGQIAEKARIEGEAQAKEQLKKDRELLEESTRKQRELQEEQLRKERESQQTLQDEQLKKERAATDKRSKEMEKSLAKKQDFYEENSGHYEGTITRDGLKFGIRISLFSTVPKPTDSRVRTPAEIEADLTALAYNVQISQWSLDNADAVTDCRVEGLRPNIKKATLNIISAQCPNSYYLVLNRTSISGTAQLSNSRDPFDIYAELKSKKAPARVRR